MPVSIEYYMNLPVEELILDEYFISSIKKPDAESEKFWNGFLVRHPERKEIFDNAVVLVNGLEFKQHYPRIGAKEKLWEKIVAAAAEQTKVVPMHRRRWIWAAASILVIAVVSILFLLQGTAKSNISTEYSEVKQISLPDQSLVTLNANSNLKYKKQWKKGEPREVWLKGEAFFEVTHLNQQGQPVKEEEKFIVHAEGIKIQVLGTSFNVNDRNGVTKVLLQSGSVQIDFDDKSKASIILKPGDVVKYDRQAKQVTQETANSESETSWKKRELKLDNTSVADVINRIENYYGYKVRVEDKSLLNRQVSGTGASTLSLEDEETLFKSLEIILNIKIEKNDKTIYIKNR